MSDYAVNTMTLHDVINQYPNFLDFISLKTTEQTTKFKEIFSARWDIYELGGETVALSKRFLTNKFNCYKDYYQELIDDYENKINYLNGIVSSETLTYLDSGSGSENNSGNKSLTENIDDTETNAINAANNSSANNGINKDLIDLPNKQTANNYISKKDNTSETKQSSETQTYNQTKGDDYERAVSEASQDAKTYQDTKSGNKSVSRTGDVNILEQKIKYQKYLRNVYLEFADKFKDCFCMLFN